MVKAYDMRILAQQSEPMTQLNLILAHIELRARNGQTDLYWDGYIPTEIEDKLTDLGYSVSLSGFIYWS